MSPPTNLRVDKHPYDNNCVSLSLSPETLETKLVKPSDQREDDDEDDASRRRNGCEEKDDDDEYDFNGKSIFCDKTILQLVFIKIVCPK